MSGAALFENASVSYVLLLICNKDRPYMTGRRKNNLTLGGCERVLGLLTSISGWMVVFEILQIREEIQIKWQGWISLVDTTASCWTRLSCECCRFLRCHGGHVGSFCPAMIFALEVQVLIEERSWDGSGIYQACARWTPSPVMNGVKPAPKVGFWPGAIAPFRTGRGPCCGRQPFLWSCCWFFVELVFEKAGSDVFLRNIDGRTARPCMTLFYAILSSDQNLGHLAVYRGLYLPSYTAIMTSHSNFSTASTDFLHRGTLTQIPAVSQACFKRKLSYLKAPQKSRGRKVGIDQQRCGVEKSCIEGKYAICMKNIIQHQPANWLSSKMAFFSMDSSRMNGCGTAFTKAFLTWRSRADRIVADLFNPSLDFDVPRKYGQTRIWLLKWTVCKVHYI